MTGLSIVKIDNFSGGLNNRDEIIKLSPNELTKIVNARINDDGSIQRRDGIIEYLDTKHNNSFEGNKIQNIFQYVELDGKKVLLVIAGGDVYRYIEDTGEWEILSSENKFNIEDKLGINVYYGDLIIADKDNGTFIYKNEIINSQDVFLGVNGNKLIFYDKSGTFWKEIEISNNSTSQIGKKLYDNLLEVDFFGIHFYKDKIFLLDQAQDRIIRINTFLEYEEEIDASILQDAGIVNPNNIFYDKNPNIITFVDDYLFVLREQNKILRVSYNSFTDFQDISASQNKGKFLVNYNNYVGYYIGGGSSNGLNQLFPNSYLHEEWQITDIERYQDETSRTPHIDGYGDEGKGFFYVKVYVNNTLYYKSYFWYKWGRKSWPDGSRWHKYWYEEVKNSNSSTVYDGWIKVELGSDTHCYSGKGYLSLTGIHIRIETNNGYFTIPTFNAHIGNAPRRVPWSKTYYIKCSNKDLISGNMKTIVLLNTAGTPKGYKYLWRSNNINLLQSAKNGNNNSIVWTEGEKGFLKTTISKNAVRLDNKANFLNHSNEIIKSINITKDNKWIITTDQYMHTYYLNFNESSSYPIIDHPVLSTTYFLYFQASKALKPIDAPYRPAVEVIQGGTNERTGQYAKYFIVYQFTGNILSSPSNKTNIIQFTDGYQYAKLTNITIPQYYQDLGNIEAIKIYRYQSDDEDSVHNAPIEEYTLIGTITNPDPTNPIEFTDNIIPNGIVYQRPKNPYKFAYSTIHLNRLILAGQPNNQSIILYSDVDLIENIPLTNFREINKDDGDFITGIFSASNYLYVFKSNNIYAIAGDVADGGLIHISKNIGCISQHTITGVENTVFFMDRTGFFAIYGNTIKKISYKIDKFFDKNYEESINFNAIKQARVVINKFRNEVEWQVPTGDATQNNISLIYNYKLNCWYVYKYAYPISDLNIIEEKDTEKPVKILGSYDGILYRESNNNDDNGEKIYWEIVTGALTVGSALYEKLFKKLFVVYDAIESFKLAYTTDTISWIGETIQAYGEVYNKNQVIRIMNGRSRFLQIKCVGSDYSNPVKLKEFHLYFLPLKSTGRGR